MSSFINSLSPTFIVCMEGVGIGVVTLVLAMSLLFGVRAILKGILRVKDWVKEATQLRQVRLETTQFEQLLLMFEHATSIIAHEFGQRQELTRIDVLDLHQGMATRTNSILEVLVELTQKLDALEDKKETSKSPQLLKEKEKINKVRALLGHLGCSCNICNVLNK